MDFIFLHMSAFPYPNLTHPIRQTAHQHILPPNFPLNPLLQSPARNNLLNIRRQLPNLLTPSLTPLSLSHSNLTPRHIPFERPSRPPRQHFFFFWDFSFRGRRRVETFFIFFGFGNSSCR